MALHDSWIDPDEVSELAGEIFPEGEKPVEDEFSPVPLLDDEDVEVIEESDGVDEEEGALGSAERIAERLRAIRVRAERAGLLPGIEPMADESPEEVGQVAAELRPFVLRGGARLAEQVQALAEWMAGGGEQVFVLDALGDELVVGEVSAGLRSGAVRLAQSWERSQKWLREDSQAAGAPLVAAALADGRVMSLVGIRCERGFFCAAMVGEEMISEALAVRVQEALFLVFG